MFTSLIFSSYLQCFATSGASLNMMAHGMVLGFPAVLLPSLRELSVTEPESPLAVGDEAASWIGNSLI